MADGADISVVIPMFNAAGSIERCLASIAAQTMMPGEVVVVDDGSRDDSAEIVERLARDFPIALRMILQANAGVSAARNAGVATARGTYVLLHDADDELRPRAVAALVELVNAAPDAALWFGDAQRLQDGAVRDATYIGKRLTTAGGDHVAGTPPHVIDPIGLTLLGAFIAPGSFLVRRSHLAAVGPCDTGLRRAVDRDMFLRLGERFPGRWVFTWEPLSTIHYTEGSLSTRAAAVRHAEATVEVLRRFEARHPAMPDRLAGIVAAGYRKAVGNALYWASVAGPGDVLAVGRRLPRPDGWLPHMAQVARLAAESVIRSRRA